MSHIVLYNYNLIINNVNSITKKITVIFFAEILLHSNYVYREMKVEEKNIIF